MTTRTKMVVVSWHDARFYQGTRKPGDMADFKMSLFESLGYLVSRNKLTTIIASERNDAGDYRDITLIPTGSIVSIVTLACAPVSDTGRGQQGIG